MSLRVLEAFGSFTRVGAPMLGRRSYGVPPGGPFDTLSFALANALLGNDANAPVWELAGASIAVEAVVPVIFAWVGGADPACAGARVQLGAGETWRLPPPSLGVRVYLAFERGAPPGDFRDSLAAVPGQESLPPVRLGSVHHLPMDAPFRHIAVDGAPPIVGPRVVELRSDRVGLRLSGAPMEALPEQASEPCTFGSIQLGNDGQLMVHGPDGPTIGGYPKLGTVIRADIDRLAQAGPGAEVLFQAVSLDEARQVWQDESGRRAKLVNAVRLAL